MKKFNKLFSVCIGISMLAGTAPIVLAENGTETVKNEFVEDFESYKIGEKPSYVVADPSMSESQVVDDGTGNKVFMIKYDRKNVHALGMNLGQTFSKGAYNYSFKVKIVNANQGDWYFPMMTLQSEKGTGVFESKIAKDGFQLCNDSWDGLDSMKKFIDSNGYYNINRVIDFDSGKHYVQRDLNGTYLEQTLKGTEFSKIFITGRTENNGFTEAQAKIDDENLKGYGVLYIDDIKITPVDEFEIESKTAPVGGRVMNTNKTFKATFNNVLGTVSADKVTVTKDETVLTQGYSVSKSGKTLVVTFEDNLTAGSSYKISAKGISMISSEAEKEYTVAEFTAVDPKDGFTENFEGYSVGDKPYFISAEAVFADSCVKEENGNKVLAVKYDRSANYANFNINLGNTFESGAYNYGFKAKVVNANQGDWYYPMMTLTTNGVGEEVFESKTTYLGWQLFDYAWMSFDDMAPFKDSNGYYNVDRILNLDTGKYLVQKGKKGNFAEYSLKKTKFSKMNIRGIYGSGDGFKEAVTGDAENKDYAVIYLDDISLTAHKEMYADGAKITDLAQAAGKNVTAKVNTSYISENDYLVIFALYNGNTLETVKTVESSDIVNNWAEAEFAIAQDTTGLKLSYMVFDSLGGLKPIGATKTDF